MCRFTTRGGAPETSETEFSERGASRPRVSRLLMLPRADVNRSWAELCPVTCEPSRPREQGPRKAQGRSIRNGFIAQIRGCLAAVSRCLA
eukprot:455858-Prymnesium_polylepis.1